MQIWMVSNMLQEIVELIALYLCSLNRDLRERFVVLHQRDHSLIEQLGCESAVFID